MSLLSSNQCIHILNEPTKSLESKVQSTLQKIMSKLSEQEYKKLYPTGSCPGKFYGAANIKKTPSKRWYQQATYSTNSFKPKHCNIQLNKISFKVIVTFTTIKKQSKKH